MFDGGLIDQIASDAPSSRCAFCGHATHVNRMSGSASRSSSRCLTSPQFLLAPNVPPTSPPLACPPSRPKTSAISTSAICPSPSSPPSFRPKAIGGSRSGCSPTKSRLCPSSRPRFPCPCSSKWPSCRPRSPNSCPFPSSVGKSCCLWPALGSRTRIGLSMEIRTVSMYNSRKYPPNQQRREREGVITRLAHPHPYTPLSSSLSRSQGKVSPHGITSLPTTSYSPSPSYSPSRAHNTPGSTRINKNTLRIPKRPLMPLRSLQRRIPRVRLSNFRTIPSTTTLSRIATTEDIEERHEDVFVHKSVYTRHFVRLLWGSRRVVCEDWLWGKRKGIC